NLAFFNDHYGYSRYDFVAQLDADHVPAPDYLFNMLRPFADPKVGYVSAPSICDKNASESWSARGRLYAEASMHGSLQAGYNGGLAPLCIGSHYAVRTVALKQIGGLGPELAEDHSTTLMMNAGGWRGVHALD
ncbi:glycosyltransferase, partial [Rhizobium ruizarguesonis]